MRSMALSILDMSKSGFVGAEDAEMVFCPYNYLLDPVVRSAMNISVDKAVLIFDEAHNIEDTARYIWSP